MSSGRGAITGKEVFQGVKEEAREINKEMERLLASFDALKKSAKSSANMKQAYAAEKQYLQLQKETERVEQAKIRTQQQLQRLQASEAAAKAAKNREMKTEVQLNAAIAREQERVARSTGKINGYYQQSAKLLNRLRNEYKSLLLKKRDGVKLTEKEAARFRDLGRSVKKLDKDLKAVDAAVGQYQRNVGNYASAMGGLFRNFRSFLGAFGLTSGLFAFAAVLKDVFRVVKEFDQAQADLAAILGKNKKEIGALTDQAKQLGATTAFTAIQVSNLQLELSKLGFEESEILAATKGVEDFAIATGVEAARAAKLAGATIRGFALDAAEADRVAGVLAISTTKSASSFQTLEIALPKVAAIANGLNFELEDTAALLGVLQNAGFEASISGTSLRQIFAALADSGSELNKEIGGNVTSFRDFVERLREMNEAGISTERIFKLVPVRAAAALKVLIQNNEDLSELADALSDIDGELENLADTKIDSITGDITLFKSAWEGFIQALDDGDGVISKTTRGLLQFLQQALLGAKLLASSSEDLLAAELVGAYKDGFDEATKLVKERVKELGITAEEAAGRLNELYNPNLEDAEDELERLEDRVKEFDALLVSSNGAAAEDEVWAAQFEAAREAVAEQKIIVETLRGNVAALNGILGVSGEEADENNKVAKGIIEALKEDIAQLTSLRDKALSETEIALYNAEIEAKQEQLKRLLGKERSFRDGTIAYFDEQIKKLQKEQKEVATTAEKYAALQRQIEAYQNQREMLLSAGSLVNPTVQGPVGEFGQDARDSASEDVASNADRAISELERINEARINGQKRVEEYVKESEQAMRDAVAQSFESFAQYYGVDLSRFKGLYDGKKNTLEDWRGAIQESVRFVAGAILEGYDREIEGNRMKLDAILNAEDATEEQKRIAKEKFQEEDRKIKKKQFQAEQNALTFQVAIDTAAAVAKILAQAAILASNPFTVALAPNAFLQAGIAAATGAAQIAFIRSQKPPEFFQGKDKWNKYEGLATWGERRPEVLIDRDGNFRVSPNSRTPLYVRQDDLIVPSVAQFERELATPGTEVHRRVASQVLRDTDERSRMQLESKVNLAPLRGLLQEEIRRGFKSAKININNRFPSNYRIDQY